MVLFCVTVVRAGVKIIAEKARRSRVKDELVAIFATSCEIMHTVTNIDNSRRCMGDLDRTVAMRFVGEFVARALDFGRNALS